MAVFEKRETLTRADHQTHRRYSFGVPPDCQSLEIRVRYAPKFISAQESHQLVSQTIAARTSRLAQRVGSGLAERWAKDFDGAELRVPNLLTISLDDAAGVYRGAGHRHAPDQTLLVGIDSASPGLVPGPLPAGDWTLTVSAHTVVSDQCELEIQIGADIASSRP